jgi:hypothetical protein
VAALKNHGFEVARLSLTLEYPAPSGDASWTLVNVEKEKIEYSFRSDGHIMKRRVEWFRKDDHRHDYGWKLHRRLKDRSASVERIRAYAERKRDSFTERDWEYPDTTLTVEFK